MSIIELKQINSTNDYIKNHLKNLKHFDVITTLNQTKGKGRRHNQWYSDENSLTFSLLIQDALHKTAIQLMPFYVAYLMRQIISAYTSKVQIKWPNDLLINNKKVSGILIESIIQGDKIHLIIGIGLNINQTGFPDSLKQTATSLKQVLNKTLDKKAILNDIVDSLISQFDDYKNKPQKILAYCNQHLAYKNQIIQFQNHQGIQTGKCLGIDHNGHLIMDIDGIQKSFVSGEIQSIRRVSLEA